MIRFIFSLFMLLSAWSMAQEAPVLSSQSEVSLITCAPGDALYEAFGHTAIRIHDPETGFDAVYNYGTFDFNQPNFYWNFVQGRSLYMLAVNRYANFIRSYQYYNRSVREQFLEVTLEERQRLLDKLTWNAQKENRDYLYDYFFDNCSTRPRDVILEAMQGEVRFDTAYLGSERLSIRALTDLYIEDEQPWGDLGIDLCLGAPIDRPATAWQYMFLPEELERAFDHAFVLRDGEEVPLVTARQTTFEARQVAGEKSWFVPQIAFVAFLLISAVFLTVLRAAGRRTRFFDGFIFILSGLIGLNAVFLWCCTNHFTAAWNWNLLWALPTNLVFGVVLLRRNRPSWTRHYALFLIVLYAALLVGWNYVPQDLHDSLRFLVILLLYVAVGVFRMSRQPLR